MNTTLKTWVKKTIVFLVTAAMAIALLPFAGMKMVTTKAEISGAPATKKSLYPNGDGTYTLSLSVTGEAESTDSTEVTKANVILVIDRSSSMNQETGSTYYPVVLADGEVPRNPSQDGNTQGTYYRQNGEEYSRVYYRGGSWYTAQTGGEVFTGPFYSRSRLWAEKNALTKDDGIIDELLKQNVPGDDVKKDIIEVAVVSFGLEGATEQDFTTDGDLLKSSINGLLTDSGTNWEEALQEANDLADDIHATQADEEVYIIFLTDGQPSTSAATHDIAANTAGWNNRWTAASDDANDLVEDGYHLYALFTWGEDTYKHYLTSLVEYAYTGEGTYDTEISEENEQYYTDADSTEALVAALKQIVHDITENVGYTNIGMTDGVTAMTASNLKATASGQISGLKYYRSGGEYGTADPDNGVYGTPWEDAPKATFNDKGEVDWELTEEVEVDGETVTRPMVLENGITYTVAFTVWPKQESLDLVADLNNGIVKYEDLKEEQKAQIAGTEAGGYTLKTNTDYPTITYSTITTTTVDGVPTSVTSDPVTEEIKNPDPVPLTESRLDAVKIWEDTLDPSQRADVGESVTLYLKVDNEHYYVDEDGNPQGVTLQESENWERSDYINIAPGLMVPESSPAFDPEAKQVSFEGTTYAIIEKGHDYIFEESKSDKHFELTAYTHHPMIIGTNDDGTLHVVDVLFTRDESGNIVDIEDINEMGTSLSATNTLKGGINITKKVVDEAGEAITDNTDPFTITVKMTDPDGNILPTKKDGDTEYTIDYRIYYGPNNPNGTEGERSGHIYATGTEFTETLYVGDTIRVVNVEDNTIYEVTEAPAAGYELDSIDYSIAYGTSDPDAAKPDPDHQVQGNSASYAVITNIYTFGDLLVSKTVEVEGGDEAQAKDKEFEFTFKLYSDDTKAEELTGRKYSIVKTNAAGAEVTGTINEGDSFTLKDGETFLIEKLPFDAYYEVTETEAAGFTVTKTNDSGTIVENEIVQAEFTNTYSVEPVTVNPQVKKVLTVEPEGADSPDIEDKFTFTITGKSVTDASGEALDITIPMPENTEITNGAAFEDPSGSGLYAFGDITFEAAGVYTYTISETGKVDGVVNDPVSSQDIVVTVSDNGEGALEASVDYTDAIVFTNKYAVTEATVKKVWDDSDNQDGKRPAELKVTLSDGTEVTLNEANSWTATVKDLPKYGEDGKEIEYTWTEADIEGYVLTDTAVEGTVTTLTNEYAPETTEATVKKVWKDGENQDGKRPAELKVTLSNGTEVTLNEANSWTATVKDLPKFKDGKEVEYTWTEADIEGYVLTNTAAEGTVTTLTNEHTPETTEATVKKVWDGDGEIPAELKVTLSNGTEVTLNEANSWTATVKDLPKYKDGKEIEYTWTEADIEGYVLTNTAAEGTVTTLTNTYEAEVMTASVKKVWKDGDDQDGIRPDSLEVDLMNGDTVVTTVTLNEANGWTAEVKDLPVEADGKKIEYTWAEKAVEGYTLLDPSVNGTLTTLTNEHIPETTEATVKKVWDDKDNKEKRRPADLKVTLSNGAEVILNDANNWTATVKDLPKFKDGKEIDYTWTESSLPEGYKLEKTEKTGTVTTLTNKLEEEPKTGDSNNMTLWMIIMALAAVAGTSGVIFYKKSRKKN